MAFPVDPVNGEKANVNGVTYVYNSTLGAWTVTSNFLDSYTGNLLVANNVTTAQTVSAATVAAGNITATGNITGNYILGNGSQLTGLSGTSITNGTSSVAVIASGGNVRINIGGATISTVHSGGIIVTGAVSPSANATYDLGTTATRWRTVYTSDLDLNNGVGDWTIVEGEDDLFLYNNKKNRVYKFALIEVDPEQATPKIDGLER